MQATLEATQPAPRRRRHLPRVCLDLPKLMAHMESIGFDTAAKVARELDVNECILSRCKETGGRISIDFMGLLWAKFPDVDWDEFLIVPGLRGKRTR